MRLEFAFVIDNLHWRNLRRSFTQIHHPDSPLVGLVSKASCQSPFLEHNISIPI